MKVAIYNSYGKPEVVQFTEMPKPVPEDHQVLIKVNASTVTSGDWRMRAGDPYVMRFYNGFRKLKRTILGHEFSGVIDTVGKAVTQFQKGDPVFGYTGSNAGAHAEYVALSADEVMIRKPNTINDHDAAALPVGASTALYFLRQAKIQPAQNVLIYGASGSVGSYAVQLAKYFGAYVTAVCSGANSDMVLALGADKVLDYRKEDFTTRNEKFDVVFDAVGKTSFLKGRKVLKSGGSYLSVAMSISLMLHSIITAFSHRYKIVSTIAKPSVKELQFLTNLVETGALKPVIDSMYSLSEIQQAHQRAESGHKKGNIVILNRDQSSLLI